MGALEKFLKEAYGKDYEDIKSLEKLREEFVDRLDGVIKMKKRLAVTNTQLYHGFKYQSKAGVQEKALNRLKIGFLNTQTFLLEKLG